MYKNHIKRWLDFTIALVAIICISPVLLLVSIWLHFANRTSSERRVKSNLNSPESRERKTEVNKGQDNFLWRWLEPAIFLQERPGKDGKIFRVIKFKTMTDERDAEGNLLPDAERLTKVGRFVRSTSIDELPQLFNVLKGDMALIGPRPLRVHYLPLYSSEQMRRHEVRPGISGWAQCHGRNAISWTEKFTLDVWYVDHCTLWTDIKIIFITVKNVLMRKDINSAEATTMYPFNGNN